mmetsp:Transcript_19248/g.22293  ORF Transcript_19248/g.22293 Transcript_19248/m.22293 type:complete len:483 (-) Transcript_19248:1230-2678(-)
MQFDKNEFSNILRSVIAQACIQAEEIKVLKMALMSKDEMKQDKCVDLQKLNHNQNTQLDLDLLTSAQQLESVGFFGAQHFSNIKKCLPDFKDFYEHEDWRIIANLGFLQIYTKHSDEEGCLHILARSEVNHSITDLGNEIANQNIFIQDDPNVAATEVLQKVSDNINVFCVKFNRFLVAEQSDVVFLCQKIENPANSEDNTVAFPMLSISHYKKKPEEGTERLEIKLGGWVLKPLGATKTLVNIFFNMKFASSEVPEEFTGKHIKTLSNMFRTLDGICRKNYMNSRLGSHIFHKAQDFLKGDNDVVDPITRKILDEEEEDKYAEERKSPALRPSSPGKNQDMFLEYPNDIKQVNPNSLKEEHKEYVLGTRSRLNGLIDLINDNSWKFLKTKNKTRIFVKKSEAGLVCVKGDTYFPFDAELILAYVMDIDRRPEYDKFTERAEIVSELPHRTFLAYAKIKKILVVASRDLTFATQIVKSKAQE